MIKSVQELTQRLARPTDKRDQHIVIIAGHCGVADCGLSKATQADVPFFCIEEGLDRGPRCGSGRRRLALQAASARFGASSFWTDHGNSSSMRLIG